MNTYVVLLRGVMPSGRNRVPVAQLRDVLSGAGYSNVRTYIQSGNVLLDSESSPEETGAAVRRLIREHIGPDLTVVVRTGEQLRQVLGGNPFAQGHDLSRVFFVLFDQPPGTAQAKALAAQEFGDEKLALHGEAAYLFIPGTYGRGILSSAYLEKKLGVRATMRNFNTLSRLTELSRASEGS